MAQQSTPFTKGVKVCGDSSVVAGGIPSEQMLGFQYDNMTMTEDMELDFVLHGFDYRAKIAGTAAIAYELPLYPTQVEDLDGTFESIFFLEKRKEWKATMGEEAYVVAVNAYLYTSQFRKGTMEYWNDQIYSTRRRRDAYISFMEAMAKANAPRCEMEAVTTSTVTEEESTKFADQRVVSEEAGMINSQLSQSLMDMNMREDQWNVIAMMNKPLPLKIPDWSTSDALGAVLADWCCPGDMLTGFHENLLKMFRFFRASPVLRVQVNGTKFHYGMLKVVFRPMWKKDDVADDVYDMNNIPALPHFTLNAGLANSGELEIPFTHLLSYFNTQRERPKQYLGQFQVVVFNRLKAATSASTSIGVSAWISWKSADIHLPCAWHDLILPKNSDKIRIIAKAESAIEAVAKDVLGAVAPHAVKAFGNVAGSMFNLDKPTEVTEIPRWVPNTVTSLNFGEGIDRSIRLGLVPGGFTQSDAAVSSTTRDDMDLLTIAKIPTRLALLQWDSSANNEDFLAAYQVSPSICTNAVKSSNRILWGPTNLAYIARAFRFWRGSLRYKIEVVCSPMMTGRLMISYNPGDNDTAYSRVAQLNTYILDVQEQNTVEFVVPFMSDRPWLKCDKWYAPGKVDDILYECCLGILNVHVQNRLAGPDGTAKSVDINIYVSAGDDFEFAVPIDLAFFTGIGKLPVTKKPKPDPDPKPETKTAPRCESLSTPSGIGERCEEGAVFLAKGGSPLSSSALNTIGEPAVNLKTLLRRSFPVCKKMMRFASRCHMVQFQNTPTLGLYNCTEPPGGDSLKWQTSTARTHLAHFSHLYTFWRGSLRYKLVMGASDPFINVRVFHTPGTTGWIPGFNWSQLNYEKYAQYMAVESVGTAIATTRIQNSIEFEVPFYTQFTQLCTMPGPAADGTLDNDFTCCTGLVTIIFETNPDKIPDTYINTEIYQSAGDDFQLNYFRGPPKMVTSFAEDDRSPNDFARWLWLDKYLDPTCPTAGVNKVIEAPRAEMFTNPFQNFRNPITTTLDSIESVKRTADATTSLVERASQRLGLSRTRNGQTPSDLSDDGNGTSEDDPDGDEGPISTILGAVSSFFSENVGPATSMVISVANLVSGFNSFLVAENIVVKTCAVVTIASELIGPMTNATRRVIYEVARQTIADNTQQGNQVARAEMEILTFVPALVATVVTGAIAMGFNAIPGEGQAAALAKQASDRIRMFNFSCTALNNVKKLWEQMKELTEWITEKVLGWFAPQMLAQMKLKDGMEEVEAWALKIVEWETFDIQSKANFDLNFKNEVLKAAETGDRLTRLMIQGKMGSEAAILRDYVKRMQVLAAKVKSCGDALPFRRDPFCVCLYGKTGLGKSGCSVRIAYNMMDHLGYPMENRWCSVNLTEKHFTENYFGQWCVFMDDISTFTTPEQYEAFMAVKSNTSYPLNMAFRKGAYFTSDFILTTTNTSHPEPNGITNIDALWRRRDMLIEMDWATDDFRNAAEAGNKVLQFDNSHARFRLLDSRFPTNPPGEWMTYPEMQDLINQRAAEHVRKQQAKLREDLKVARIPLPDDAEQILALERAAQLAEVEAALHPHAEMNKETTTDRVIVKELAAEDPDMALWIDEPFLDNLEWDNSQNELGQFALTDEATQDETCFRSWANFRIHAQNIGADEQKMLHRISRPRTYLQKMKSLLDNGFETLKDYLKTVKDKARKLVPSLDSLNTWPVKLTAALAVCGLLIKGTPKILHSCVCITTRHYGYRCPLCGRWPEIAKCENAEWLKREWETMYGKTTEYEDGRVTNLDEEANLARLEGEPADRIWIGTKAKLKTEMGPYNTETKGMRSVKIIANAGPYANETNGQPQIRILANNGPYNSETTGQTRPRVMAHAGQKTNDLIEYRIAPYLYRVRADDRQNAFSMNALAIGDRTVLLPRHFMECVPEEGVFEIYHSGAWLKIRNDKTRWTAFDNKDLVAFEMPIQFHQHKDLTTHFVREKDLPTLLRSEAILVKQISENRLTLERVEAEAEKEIRYLQEIGGNEQWYYVQGSWKYRALAAPGSCGSVLISVDDRLEGQILGIHSCGDGRHGWSQLITREMIAGLVKKKLGTPLPRVESRFSKIIPEGHFGRVGSVEKGKGIRQPTKTTIIPTQIASMISKPVTAPAVMHSSDTRLTEPTNVMTKAIGKYGQCPEPLNSRHLDLIEESMNAHLETWTVQRKPTVLTTEQAIAGIEGLDGYGRLPLDTSPGYPYTLTRPSGEQGKAYLFDLETNTIKNAELRTNFDARERLAMQGERSQSIWTCCLKDERRPLAKIAAGSTRLFVIPPVDYSLLARKYNLDFVVAVKDNRHNSFTKVGIDPQSLEWTQLYHYLAEFSEYVVAGDFERFDGTLHPEIAERYCRNKNYFYTFHGECTDSDRRVRETLIDEGVHTVHIVNDEIFVNHTGNESGDPETVTKNSFTNEYYTSLAWLGLAEKHDPEKANMAAYRRNVRTAVYGDDNLIAIKQAVLEWFNQETIAEFLKGYGITYTNESKTGITKWKRLTESTFLKQGFTKHESINGIWIPTMTEATIMELLNWTRIAPDQNELLESNCNDALRYAYFYGAEYFNNLRSKIVLALKQVGLKLDIMTYNDFHYWFLYVIGKLPHLRKSECLLEKIARNGNSSFARLMNKTFFMAPYKLLSLCGLMASPETVRKTDDRWAVAIPSGEGKSWLCKHYPSVFVDHDELLLPAARRQLKEKGLNWNHLWKIFEQDFPQEDRRILLCHHPNNTKRRMLGTFKLPKPCYVRANFYQRLRLADATVCERDERNRILLQLALEKEPSLFNDE